MTCHDDWADPGMNEYEYVCPNRDCEHYSKAVYVRCRTELGSTSVLDDRDLDCECGDRLVQVDLLGCESVSPETRRRYKGLAATACLMLGGLTGCGASVAQRVNAVCGQAAYPVSIENHAPVWGEGFKLVKCSDGSTRMVGE